ncbi:hypothetical protein MZD04_gp155 [Pseudomonas phage Psa21]|uniref:Uncharacterized protein n=1 Tax=Pseudomonas phage Psa21 TaxID=2530023 RepID=A0A481W4U6_9CAUD|nr:hypothetical protein MZD04_gp155 [Pseudomonas phage Psa21]QBJ02682.1 hypothetical protein PSA21_155 [Pseudomonas phage Psa21]
MPFDIPKHAIAAFLRLAEKDDLVKNVSIWSQYMESFTTPGFIENGEWLFSAHMSLSRVSGTLDFDTMDAMAARMLLLVDLFKDGITLQTDVAERLVVKRLEDSYTLSHESIGRMRDWVYIDQGNTQTFPIDKPYAVMEAIAKRFSEPWRTN